MQFREFGNVLLIEQYTYCSLISLKFFSSKSSMRAHNRGYNLQGTDKYGGCRNRGSNSPKSWKWLILSSHSEQLFPWGANLSSNLVSGSCYVTNSHPFQGRQLNSFGCQQNPGQDASGSIDRLYIVSMNCWSSLILENLHILIWSELKSY